LFFIEEKEEGVEGFKKVKTTLSLVLEGKE
jgi:hypothetical protein